MTAVQTTPSKKRQNIYENVKSSPSKSSITSGDSARSGSISDRSDQTDRSHKRAATKNKRKKSEIEFEDATAATGNDGDVTDRDKLHDVTCLSLPPLPAGAQKTLTQTDSFTSAPPTAEQVRRDSLLGSLPPLEPVAIAGDITADINDVLG